MNSFVSKGYDSVLVSLPLAAKSPVDLFYCPTLVDDGSGAADWKYEFKWKQSRTASVEEPYIWQILLGDHAEHLVDPLILENFTPLTDFPFGENTTLSDYATNEHMGTLIDVDHAVYKNLYVKELNLLSEKEDLEKDLREMEVAFAKAEANDYDFAADALRENQAELELRLLGISEELDEVQRRIRQIDRGWFPQEIGDSISWNATASNYDPDLILYWSFLDGNITGVNEYLTAIRYCEHQDLIWDDSNHTLRLTESAVMVHLSHLIKDDDNELQDLLYDDASKKLYLSKSNKVVEFSGLDTPTPALEWNSTSMELGLSNSNEIINLKALTSATDLSFHKDTNHLEVADSGQTADLSPLRVVALQASIKNVNGNVGKKRRLAQNTHVMEADEKLENDVTVDVNKRQVRGWERKLQGPKDLTPAQDRRLPKHEFDSSVRYGQDAKGGFTMLFNGRLLGMSITADFAVTKGIIQVQVTECSDLINSYAPNEVLELSAGSGRSDVITFSEPIPVNAGDIICFLVDRVGDEKVESGGENDNPASLVLLLEQ